MAKAAVTVDHLSGGRLDIGLGTGIADVVQDAPFPTLCERWQRAEELGSTPIYLADHTGDYRNLEGHWFEAWTTLAAMAVSTPS